MSMPERIWRIVRGRWLLAEEQIREALAEEEAARELASDTADRRGVTAGAERRAVPAPQRSSRAGIPASPRPLSDPLAADLALLGAPPACDMPTLDRVYEERLAELRQEELPGSTTDRSVLAARRTALAAAYERLRDAINTTETRFEKLEF